MWAVWVPAQIINFGLSPMWFRVPFVSLISSLWTCYVSITRGKMEAVPEDEIGSHEHDMEVEAGILSG